MINIKKALKNNRVLKSLTGLSIEKFKELVPYFEVILKEENGKRIQNNKNRQRKVGGRYTNRWMHQLLPILEKTLDRRLVLPKRKIENIT